MQPKSIILFFAVTLFSLGNAQSLCTTGQLQVKIIVAPDNYPNETSWSLHHAITNTLIDSNSVGVDSICVSDSTCLKFTIYDRYGDGMCCHYGNGSYDVELNGALVASGGHFGYSESTYFNCPQGHDCSNPLIAIKDTMTSPTPETWYSYIPDSTGLYEISSCDLGNACDVKIYMYDHCNGLLITENNVGAIFYDNDGCGNLQSKISAVLIAGSVLYIRIGDNDTSCAGQAINWQIKFNGPIHGCTDSLACNYDPVATVNDSSCIYHPDSRCPAPDLTVDEQELISSLYADYVMAGPSSCYVNEGCLAGYGMRRIIRFSTHIRNIGDMDYYIGVPDSTNDQFVYDACHGHWHFVGYAEYAIYDQDNVPLQQGFKNGFCVIDLECGGGGMAKYGCTNMGLSSGCGDVYHSGIDCQWIDITDIDTGNYTLVVRVNWDRSPDRYGNVERTYSNNLAQVCFHLGYDSPFTDKVFTILPDCVPFVDCAGDPFGKAVPDCAGVCNGTALLGDADANLFADSIDVNEYLEGIIEGITIPTACNDLNGDNQITVTDVARLNGCLRFNDGNHQHPATYQNTHKHCEFPFNISNPFDTVVLSIADTNLLHHYIDLSIYNPTCQVLGYEFKMNGLVVDSVHNLISGDYSPDIRTSPSGHLVGIVLDENSLDKQLAPLNFLRVYFSALTDTQICITEIVSTINSNYEEVNGRLSESCVSLIPHQDTLRAGVDFISSENLTILPNPSSGIFEVYLANKSFSGIDIKVFDVLGRNIYETTLGRTEGHITLDLRSRNVGIYFMQLSVNGRCFTKRLFLTSNKFL